MEILEESISQSTQSGEATDLLVRSMCAKARKAALALTAISTDKKNAVLQTLAVLLEGNTELLLAENSRDIAAGEAVGLSQPLLERLKLTPERIVAMAEGARQVADLPDPVGEEIERTIRPNGLDIRKIRVPIGVIGIIYESRPNVTVDCAILCFKSGNSCILRGGKEAFHTNCALASLIQQALRENGVEESSVQFISTRDRQALHALLKCEETVDCIIPRGGEGLIRFVAENSRIPVIKHYKGVCCVYIDREADPDLAESITVNAKVQRPSVCNAAENLFIHQDAAPKLLPRLARALVDRGVELRVDQGTEGILSREEGIPMVSAREEDFYEEYLDLVLSIKIVSSLEEGIADVNKYGSSHSDAIVTGDKEAAEQFLTCVDSATVYWNASTRFTDGFEFGLGAEIGISTDKIHARGPMGLRELTTYKFLIYGEGQTK